MTVSQYLEMIPDAKEAEIEFRYYDGDDLHYLLPETSRLETVVKSGGSQETKVEVTFYKRMN